MTQKTGWKVLALALCLTFMVAACGQKGDLYLPEGQASMTGVA